MAVNLSIKNVPEAIVERLRHRAKCNHRSLQGELLAVVEQTVHPSPLKPRDVLKRLQALHFSTPAESLRMIREDRRAR